METTPSGARRLLLQAEKNLNHAFTFARIDVTKV